MSKFEQWDNITGYGKNNKFQDWDKLTGYGKSKKSLYQEEQDIREAIGAPDEMAGFFGPGSVPSEIGEQIIPGAIEGGLGVANLVQAPVGVPWWAARKAGVPLPEMPMASELGANALKSLGYDLEANRPKTLAGKIAREGISYAVPGGPGAKVLSAVGRKVSQHAPKIAKGLEKYSGFVGPKDTFSKEGARAIAGGAATGATVGSLQHALGDEKDVAARTIGGLGLPLGLGAAKALRGKGISNAQNRVKDFFESRLSPEEKNTALSNLKNYKAEDFPEGYAPTTAEITESPQLAAFERAMTGQTTSPDFSKISSRRREQNEAILSRINEMVPEEYNAEQAQDFVQNYFQELQDTLRKTEELAGEKAANKIIEEFTRRETPQETGSRIQKTIFEEHLEPLKENRRKEAAKSYEAVETTKKRTFPKATNFFIDERLKNARGTIEAKLKKIKSMLPSKDNEFIQKGFDVKRVNPRIGELEATQQYVKQELSEAKPGSPMSNLLTAITKKLDEDMENFLPKKEAAAKYREQSEPISKIEKHPAIGKDVKTNILKEFKRPGSNVPEKYIKGDSSLRYAEDLLPYVRNDRETMLAIEGYINSSIIKNTVDPETGHINIQKLNSWKKDHPGAFVLNHRLERKINNASNAQKYFLDLTKENSKTISAFEKSAASKFLKKDADKVAVSVLSSQNAAEEMKDIVSLLSKDKNALPGFQRSIAEHLSKNFRTLGEGGTNISIDKFNKLMQKNEKALSEVFDKEQMDNLKKIQHALMARNKALTLGKTLGSETAPKINTMADILINKATSGKLGRIPYVGPIFSMGSAALDKFSEFRNKEYNQLLTKAIVDPEFAKLIFTDISKMKKKDVNKLINEYIKNNTLKSIERINQANQRD